MLKNGSLAWHDVVNNNFKRSLLSTTLLSVAALTACSSTPTKSTVSSSKTELLEADNVDSLEDLLYATDMRAVESDRLLVLRYGDVWKRMTVGFKMNLNLYDPRIEAQRNWFISRQPYLDRLSARASRYLYYTVKEAERRGLPTELALLPVIESSYDPAATSSASAAGLWQFIPSTGRIYGLRQSSLYDGRRDVVESTRAAYEYLSSLYNQFGSWELALASYNAGPGRIQQAINRNKAAGLPTDYWSLRLPAETMNYVPRFLAVAQIIKNQSQYGVQLQPIANRPHFREVAIPGSIDLNELSRITGVSRGELYALNPAHRGNYTDPMAPPRILIPNEVSASVDRQIAKLNTTAPATGTWIAKQSPSTTSTSSISTTNTRSTAQPSSTRSSISQTNTTQPSINRTVSGAAVSAAGKKVPTPQGSNALAAFASNADVPSAPRLPVSITPASNVAPLKIEPPISEQEKQAILAENQVQTSTTDAAQQTAMLNKIVEPEPSDSEKQQVIRELQQISPQGTEIVDPLDGKIKLTAIQSSQSIAEQKGEDVKINYAYPKAVTEAEKQAHSEALARNANKPVVETQNEVVVVAPKGQRKIYSVQSGDTLLLIAQKFSVNWRDIAAWNQINPESNLLVGTRLYLYDVKPQTSASSNKRPESYVVKAGDSLTAIAQKFELRLQDLAEWNKLTPSSNVQIGQRLSLQDSKAPVSKTAGKSTSASKLETENYSVKRGEYLQMIATRYDLSLNELLSLNPELSANSNLLLGQSIKVPKSQSAPAASSRSSKTARSNSAESIDQTSSYTVVAGDYLSTVAGKYKISVGELAAMNNIKTSTPIRVGQKLKVPLQQPERSTQAERYTVKRGETLSSVAKKFDLSVAELASYNQLRTTARLDQGMILKVTPSNSSLRQAKVSKNPSDDDDRPVRGAVGNYRGQTESYQVKSGESLTLIANRYAISVADLAGLNKLSSKTSLRRGQSIKVPKRTTTYKVKSGDNLTKIAQRYNISIQQLAEMNAISTTTQVRIGQQLTVPN